MSTRDPLEELAALIRQKNIIGDKITGIIKRAALIGHTGEYIASQVFAIKLHENAREKGSDGLFLSDPLQNRRVDVKWYTKQEWILDIKRDKLPDYFLVFTGPIALAVSSSGKTRPWVIERAYLFEALPLIEYLDAHEIPIREKAATDIPVELWVQAEIYPTQTNTCLMVSEEQRRRLRFFLGNLDADKSQS